MFTLLGMAGGAAAMRIVNKKSDIIELKRREAEMKTLIEDLKREIDTQREGGAEKAVQLSSLERIVEEINARAGKLEEEKTALQQEKEQLREANMVLEVEYALAAKSNKELQDMQAQLTSEKDQLAQQMEQLEHDKQAQIDSYQAQLDELRSKVSDVMTKLLNKTMSEQDATQAINSLGCEIEFVDSSSVEEMKTANQKAVEWSSSQTELLLDHKDRIERLVASCMGPRIVGPNGSSRIPLITFPSSMANPSPLKLKPPAAADSPKASTLRLHDGVFTSNTDVIAKDQLQAGASAAFASATASTTSSTAAKPAITASSGSTPKKPPRASSSKQPVKIALHQASKSGGGWLARLPGMDQDTTSSAPFLPASSTGLQASLSSDNDLDMLSLSRDLVTRH